MTDSVDPRAPRFGQALTATGLLAAVVLGFAPLLYAVTAVLVVAVASRWRLDLYAALWRRVVRPVVGPPAATEPAAPHRFAKVLGATGTTAATLLTVAGVPFAGYGVAVAVAAAAGLAATTGVCIGCRLYRQVSFLRRRNVV
ncbi:DUF4395 family protein [Halobacteriaceae archaeon GCM10025711]